MPRTITHARKTKSRDMVRTKIDTFYTNGDALFREWSERDYGIDAVVELFEDGYPTGKIAYVQLKGTVRTIEPMKIGPLKGQVVSCNNVSSSTMEYALQNRIPMLLIYASVATPECFYYIDLQSQINDIEERRTRDEQDSHTVHIPIGNCVIDDLTGFFDLINSYY